MTRHILPPPMQMTLTGTVVFAAFLVAAPSYPEPAAQVYNTRFLQSPVHAGPGDVLLLPGADISPSATVVYQRITNPLVSVSPPSTMPSVNTAALGQMSVPSNAAVDGRVDTPASIVVKAPSIMDPTAIYALWIKNPAAPYSEPVMINDPRPRWSTPSVGYETADAPGPLARTVKIVGRNLAPQGSAAFVFLNGPISVAVPAYVPSTPGLVDHTLLFDLPAAMPIGVYSLDIELGGVRYPVPEGRLEIRPDPSSVPLFLVSDHGCKPNDGIDDTACVQEAIDTASASGGGTVFFLPGQWDLLDPQQATTHVHDGLLVPPGINLAGEARDLSILAKGPSWTGLSLFTLQGEQTVEHLTFKDITPSGVVPSATAALRLGRQPWILEPNDPRRIDDVTIADCAFENIYTGVAGSGVPIRNLRVVQNSIEAYRDGLFLSGNPNVTYLDFDIEDSVVADNDFYPGDYIDLEIFQGAIASHLGASTRVDFSDNSVNGRINGGWRAGLFFHMSASHENLLISNNALSCTGSKGGDGEAIVFDGNHNVLAYGSKHVVEGASNSSVTFAGDPDVQPSVTWSDLWVQVVNGPGVGQARKVQHIGVDPSGMLEVLVTVPWDVVPVAAQSEITLTRVVHATAVVDNVVDNRGCPAQHTRGYEGLIGWASMTVDSILDHNTQYETGGLTVSTSFAPEGNAPGVSARDFELRQ